MWWSGRTLSSRSCLYSVNSDDSLLAKAMEDRDVRSVFVPYECTKCLREENLLIDVVQHRAALAAMRPPSAPCPECGGAMELADLPERYFLFVRDGRSGT